VLLVIGIGVLGFFLWQRGLIIYNKPNTTEKPGTDFITFRDERYGFTFNLPSYYDLNPRPNSNSSLTNVVWTDFDGYSSLNIDTLNNEGWTTNNGESSSVRNLWLSYLQHMDYATWKNRAINISKPKNTINQEVEFPDGVFLLSIRCSPCGDVVDTSLIIPVNNNLLVVRTHHYEANQPEVNALFSNIYSTFKFTE
ncbi:MAG: hypothetical protein ACD_19C00136G0001, partial [uncultured bacterium]